MDDHDYDAPSRLEPLTWTTYAAVGAILVGIVLFVLLFDVRWAP
jgi:hypothetical protein